MATKCFEEKIGEFYARMELDCVVELAIAVAFDSKRRPNQYKNTEIVATLTNFTTKVGKDPDWPDYDQRMEYYSPLFGAANSYMNLKNSMLEAARLYAERVFDTGETMLKQSFLDKAVIYRAGLTTKKGNVTTEAVSKTAAIYGQAVTVLQDAGVASAFGLSPAAVKPWPFEPAPTGDGAVLAGTIAETLTPPNHARITGEQFLLRQLVAVRGEETIAKLTAVKKGADDEVSALIQAAYSWYTSSSSSILHGAGTPAVGVTSTPILAANTANIRRQQSL